MADSRLRSLERAAATGDLEAALRLAEEKRRQTPIHPKALLVGPCGKRGEALHVLQDRRDPGIDAGPKWEALCHRHKNRTRRLSLTEGYEPRWALIGPLAGEDGAFLDFPTAWAIQRGSTLPHDPRCSSTQGLLCDCGGVQSEWYRRERERRGITLACARCSWGRWAESWDEIRSGQLLALGMGIPNSAQTGLFTGATP